MSVTTPPMSRPRMNTATKARTMRRLFVLVVASGDFGDATHGQADDGDSASSAPRPDPCCRTTERSRDACSPPTRRGNNRDRRLSRHPGPTPRDAVTVLLASTLSTRNSTFVIRHGSRSGRTPRLSRLEGRQPVRDRNDMASARPPSQFVPA
jgi:hypothetical protein